VKRRPKMSPEERRLRARDRWRRKHGWEEIDYPVPNGTPFSSRLLPFVSEKTPDTDRRLVPPAERKPRKPRTKKGTRQGPTPPLPF
jgi:hypothetical protein